MVELSELRLKYSDAVLQLREIEKKFTINNNPELEEVLDLLGKIHSSVTVTDIEALCKKYSEICENFGDLEDEFKSLEAKNAQLERNLQEDRDKHDGITTQEFYNMREEIKHLKRENEDFLEMVNEEPHSSDTARAANVELCAKGKEHEGNIEGLKTEIASLMADITVEEKAARGAQHPTEKQQVQ